MEARVLTRCLITSTQMSLVSLSTATRSSSLILVDDLKIIEKAASLLKFSISELENIQMSLKNNNLYKVQVPIEKRRIFAYFVENVRLKAISYFIDVPETEAVLAIGV